MDFFEREKILDFHFNELLDRKFVMETCLVPIKSYYLVMFYFRIIYKAGHVKVVIWLLQIKMDCFGESLESLMSVSAKDRRLEVFEWIYGQFDRLDR